jgi:hypothetical protein
MLVLRLLKLWCFLVELRYPESPTAELDAHLGFNHRWPNGPLLCEEVDASISSDNRSMRAVGLSVFSVLFVLTAGLTSVAASTPLFRFTPFDSSVANGMLNYQLNALPVAGLALLLTFLFAGRIRLVYLNFKRTAEMPLLRSVERWKMGDRRLVCRAHHGRDRRSSDLFPVPSGWVHLPLGVRGAGGPVSSMNAFIEETIFRLPYVTMGDNDTNSRLYGLIM